MELSRRFLPPMHALSALEAAARLGSFTAAATELHLTQSAVSRQIRLLEEILGAQLFVRERQTVRLTSGGEAYAQEVRESLRRISQATLGFRASPDGGTLNLAILPTFGTRWLAPRLANFLAAHPGVTINLATRLAPFDFRTDPLDAAIHFGEPEWPGAELEPLMRETVVPVCSPFTKKQHRFTKPADLRKVPLLHVASRPHAWARWFQDVGVNVQEVPGMVVDQFATAAQAAVADLGVALLPQFLVREELAQGRLVEAIARRVESKERYYLAWPSHRTNYPPLQAFRAWLKEESGRELTAPDR